MPLNHLVDTTRIHSNQCRSLMLIEALIEYEVPDVCCHCSSYRRAGLASGSHCLRSFIARTRQALTDATP